MCQGYGLGFNLRIRFSLGARVSATQQQDWRHGREGLVSVLKMQRSNTVEYSMMCRITPNDQHTQSSNTARLKLYNLQKPEGIGDTSHVTGS